MHLPVSSCPGCRLLLSGGVVKVLVDAVFLPRGVTRWLLTRLPSGWQDRSAMRMRERAGGLFTTRSYVRREPEVRDWDQDASSLYRSNYRSSVGVNCIGGNAKGLAQYRTNVLWTSNITSY